MRPLEKTNRPELADLEQRLDRYTKQLNDNPLLGGRLFENVELAAGAGKVLNHGLGGKPRGLFAVGTDYQSIKWSNLTRESVTVTSAHTGTYNIYIF